MNKNIYLEEKKGFHARLPISIIALLKKRAKENGISSKKLLLDVLYKELTNNKEE